MKITIRRPGQIIHRRAGLRKAGVALGWLIAFVAAGARAQPADADIPRVAILFPDTREARAPLLSAFMYALRRLGHRDNETILIEARYAGGSASELSSLARAMAESDPRVLVAAGTGPAEALRLAAPAKTILFIGVGDPVARGYVADLRRPGGNMTGSSDALPDAAERRIALLAEALPHMRELAVISNPALTPPAPIHKAAAERGLRVLNLDVRTAADLEPAYARLASERPAAVIVVPNPLTFAHRQKIAAVARAHGVATLFGWREFMDAGGLMSLGAHMQDVYAAAARQLDRLLKGSSPAVIPVEAPKFELVVDLRTALDMGIELPRGLIERADAVLR